MKYFFVINPSAGKGNKIEKLKQSVGEICTRRGLDFSVYLTTAVGDAERYVRQLCEENRETEEGIRIFACGGDGTINECFNGAYGFANVELGVIPIGTGNDFVRNFGDSEMFFDIETQLDANARAIDLIKYNDRYCVNMINIGFDCEVAARTAILKKNPMIPSKFAYISGLLGEFIKKSGTVFRCKIDGTDVGRKTLQLSLFANGGFCGGGFFVAPEAELFDGFLDYCLVREVTRFELLSIVGKYKRGAHLQMENRDDFFEYGKCREIELLFDEPKRICVDGEIEVCERLHMTIEKEVARLVIPGYVPEKKRNDCAKCAAV